MQNPKEATKAETAGCLMLGIAALVFAGMLLFMGYVWSWELFQWAFPGDPHQEIRRRAWEEISRKRRLEHDYHCELILDCEAGVRPCTDAEHWQKAQELLDKELAKRRLARPDMKIWADPIHWVDGDGTTGYHYQRFCAEIHSEERTDGPYVVKRIGDHDWYMFDTDEGWHIYIAAGTGLHDTSYRHRESECRYVYSGDYGGVARAILEIALPQIKAANPHLKVEVGTPDVHFAGSQVSYEFPLRLTPKR